jgi:hypothetical protein
MIISNFQDCIRWYNDWAIANNFGNPITTDAVNEMSANEELLLSRPLQLQINSNN